MRKPNGLAIIVAMDKNRAIGSNGKLPWDYTDDLRRFRRMTMGHVVMMGRKTHESIGRILPGRINMVLTRNKEYQPNNPEIQVFHSFEKMLEEAVRQDPDRLPFCVGGSTLYEEALPEATHLYITDVMNEAEEADTFFPEWDPKKWMLMEESPSERSPIVFRDYRKVKK